MTTMYIIIRCINMMEIGRGDSSAQSALDQEVPWFNSSSPPKFHSKIFVVPQSNQRMIKKINKLSYAAVGSLISKVL